MKLTAKLKLLPTEEQATILKQTLQTANAACNYISQRAYDAQTFRQFPLHKLVYADIRTAYPLTAQVVVRCISKVADAYKIDRANMRHFKPLGAIAYDTRILRYRLTHSEVSIWTLAGRQTIPFTCGDRQRELLQTQHGESGLCYVDGIFYLLVTCDIETPEPIDIRDVLGLDMGIVNIAVDSDGNTYSGAAVEQNRRIYAHRRRNLQRKGTRSAKRKLKLIAGKQARYQADVNHVISKQVVRNAERTGRAIAIEELRGIRDRVRACKRQRARLANWAFFQLRCFIDYKAALAGMTVLPVDPRNTSRTCPACGCIDKANRPSQSLFLCVSCGHSGPADHVAALNIRARAAVNQPMVATLSG